MFAVGYHAHCGLVGGEMLSGDIVNERLIYLLLIYCIKLLFYDRFSVSPLLYWDSILLCKFLSWVQNPSLNFKINISLAV